ncbi:MAG: hypothetical protein ABIR82_06555 [Nocardioides sp.]
MKEGTSKAQLPTQGALAGRGAARVYDPIATGEAGEDLHGCLVKDSESLMRTGRRRR